MRLHALTFACIFTTTACYTGTDAARDVNAAWRGHARGELEARLGVPRLVTPAGDGTTQVAWVRRGHDITLPSGAFALRTTPNSFDARLELRPGEVRSYDVTIARATLGADDRVLAFDSGWLAAGIPRGMNLRTGIVFGLSGGFGRLDDAASPLPSLAAYLGGMLAPRVALVGAYAFANAKEGDAYVQGHSFGLAAQYWPTARLSVRAGPALVIDTDPAPDSAALAPGGIGAISFAVVRAGSFVLDLRLDATVSSASAFGVLGVGVNVN